MGAKKQWQEAGRLGCFRVKRFQGFLLLDVERVDFEGKSTLFLVGVTGIYFLDFLGGFRKWMWRVGSLG